MLKYLTILYFLFFLNQSVAQQASVAWVKENSVCIKWFTNNFEQTKHMLTLGATIQRVELEEKEKAEDANYDNAPRFFVPSIKDHFNKLNENDSIEDKHKVLLEPFFSSRTQDPSAKNFAFGLFLIANASDSLFQVSCNNWFIDSTAQIGKKYAYRIVVKNNVPWYLTVENDTPTSYPLPDLTLQLDQKKTVNLTWSSYVYEQFFFAWDIEFSLDVPDAPSALNSDPFIPFTSSFEKPGTPNLWRHDDTQQGHWHFYRIVGFNHFGARVGFSEWQKIYVPKRINAWIAIDTITAANDTRLIDVHAFGDNAGTHIEGYRILRSRYQDSGFVELTKIMSNESFAHFTLSDYRTGDAFYYVAEAFGSNDTVRSLPYYFFTLDQEPPDAPQGLKGDIDSLGVATLHWTPIQADDVMGYRVFRANSPHEEFVERSKTLQATIQFSDTLSLDNLTPTVYYYVQAVDGNFNNSRPSDTLRLLKPDTIPPIAAVIREIRADSGQVQIFWTNSSSADRAAFWLCQTCLQKDTLLFSLDFSVSNLHYNAPEGLPCSYSIEVRDSSGNIQTSLPYAYTYEPGYRSALVNLQAQVDRSTRQIILTWNPPHVTVYNYQIYRATAGKTPKLYATFGDVHATSFIDQDMQPNNQYTYVVKYITAKGIHSLAVEVVVVY